MFWGIVLLVTSCSALAGADPTTIVLVRSPNTALDERLDAELSTLGFAVNEVGPFDQAIDLETLARDNGAIAAIRVVPDDAVELWVAARTNAAPVHEKVHLDARRGWNVAAVLALEALRAHLLDVREPPAAEVSAAPSPPPAPSPPLVPSPSIPPETRPWLWLHLGAGADVSPGGFSPSADVLLALRWEPRPWVSISAFGTFTPAATRLSGPGGQALVRRSISGLAVDAQTSLSRMTLSVGAGLAFVFTAVDGTGAASGYTARDTVTRALAPVVRGGAALEINARLRARLDLAAGATFPQATVSFADQPIATWGRPFVLLTLGIEWGIIR